ncbi:hypothetical protein DEU56DRAFT_761563 [Suillus clintonianus]|uniref:uncharacterized protein n=1 Tax=Suillus clintonianus TaxID=1904413 RepID=UPI001B865D7E|nr:uncharacterized protein DEU56DRAFT_761563 [Suillus clintonianus]KAG2116292.1 hypothetical protein DEU56DRAFT_761563 [Suillus clintonianus]
MATQIALRAKIMVTSIRDESHMKGGNQDLATQIAPRANKKVKRRDQDLATQIPLRAKIMVTSIRDESHMKGGNQDLATQITPRANKKVKRRRFKKSKPEKEDHNILPSCLGEGMVDERLKKGCTHQILLSLGEESPDQEEQTMYSHYWDLDYPATIFIFKYTSLGTLTKAKPAKKPKSVKSKTRTTFLWAMAR